MVSWSLWFFIVSVGVSASSARYIRDSAITKIALPYDGNSAMVRYGFGGNNYHVGKAVYAPAPSPLQIIDLNLNTKEDLKVLKMQGARESRVSLVDGAYPVYYTPSNVNGQFNGKIYLLKY